MATATLNISLPEPMKVFVEERLVKDGYGTISEYVRELIRQDQKQRAEQELETLLLEGLRSGAATPFTKADFAAIKERGLRRIAQKNKK